MPILTNRKNKSPLGIYVHVPFCRSRCAYCDFCTQTDHSDKLIDGYLDAVCQHIKEAGTLAPNHKVDTIYFGGGTPSFLGADALATILTTIRRSFDVDLNAEITFEANPDSVSDHLLKRLRAEGFNRVSLGIQSDDNDMLERLNRPHNYIQAVNAYQRIRKAGFKNVSVDLIYGLPDQNTRQWLETLEHVLELMPEHISLYGLEVHPGTPIEEYERMGRIPDEDTFSDMYLSAVKFLENRGFRQYEISNFARKGLYSRHNMKYWTGGEFLAFGPSAASDFAGSRYKLVSDLRAYIQGIKVNGEVMEEVDAIPLRERAAEYIMTRLRTTAGMNRQEYEKLFLLPFDPLEEILEQNQGFGLASQNPNGNWRLTPRGFLVSNKIISDLQLAQENSKPLTRI
jgi:oxygen-independent coproporphyrinogen-3 oxidase